eukprot:c22988_g1_i2 orf=453-1829(+)
MQWAKAGGGYQSACSSEPAKPDKGLQGRREMECAIVKGLDADVKFWTDYSKVHFHPLSIYELQGVWRGLTPFGDFGSGRGLLLEPIQEEETQERLRFFTEECDHLQGLQVLVDDSTGFAGIGADFLESLADEYGHTPVLLYAVRSPNSFNRPVDLWNSTNRALHDSVSFIKLSSFSHLIIPIGLPHLSGTELCRHLHINDANIYHSSAVYSAAINCITLLFRMESVGPSSTSAIGSTDMSTLVKLLSEDSGRKTSILDVSMPAALVSGAKSKGNFNFGSLHPVTPNVGDTKDGQSVEAVVIQGALKSDPLARASISEVVDHLYSCTRRFQQGLSICHMAVSPCPLAIPLPFPPIFAPSVGSQGEILSDSLILGNSMSGIDVPSIPMAARMRVSEAVLPYLQSRLYSLKQLALARGSLGRQILEGWGFQKDEIQELFEYLSKVVGAYGGATKDDTSDSD